MNNKNLLPRTRKLFKELKARKIKITYSALADAIVKEVELTHPDLEKPIGCCTRWVINMVGEKHPNPGIILVQAAHDVLSRVKRKGR